MSSRPPQHPDRRTAGSSADYIAAQSSRSQQQQQQPTSAAERATSRSERRMPSPREPYTNPAHKRSASGNPRPASRNPEDRRVEDRRSERVTVTTRERLISRTRSPDRQTNDAQSHGERWRQRESRSRPSEARTREPRPEIPSAPWEPIATLTPHSTAPLAIRVSRPPLAKDAPLQPPALSSLSLEEQEAAMIEDLLFVFMGYEGQYIRYQGYNPEEERDRLTGPQFQILPGLDPSLLDLTELMLKMASHYSALEMFIDVQSRDEFGAVNHALCAAVRKHLQDYLIMVAQLETQFLTNESFTLHLLHVHALPTTHMMFQLYSLAQEFLKRNSLLDDDDDQSSDDSDPDDIDNILENLRRGGELNPGSAPGKKICRGGIVIGLISNRLETMSGDPSAKALLTALLRDASRPYMAMLNEWLHHGGITDPHAEFLIKEQKTIRRDRLEQDYTDDYWERRYTIREHEIPPQLQGVKDKVLLAGKYLNVVRECGGVDVSKVAQDLPQSFDDPLFLDNVNNAYAYANESLMKLLLTTHSLPARLRSLKHYFFLDPSDYFTYFLELGGPELRKPVKSQNIVKLQSLLDIVLRQPGTVVSMDPFKEDVHIEMNEISLIKMLQRVVSITGIEQGEALQPLRDQPVEQDKNAVGFTSLQLNYTVPFPVSLVISRKTVWRYQAIFRYLLSLRYLESQLSTTWHTHMSEIVWVHKSSEKRLEIWKRRVWTLRARMIVFVQQLLYFCTLEVLEPNWQALMARLKAKDGTIDGSGKPDRTVDELMQDHVDFLDTCLKGCMLTNGKLIRIHSKLMQTCTAFAMYANWLSRELGKSDPDLLGPHKPENISDKNWKAYQAAQKDSHASRGADVSANESRMHDEQVRIDNLFEIIGKWETNFSRHLQILLDALNHYAATETVVLLSLCARLATANQGTAYSGLRSEEDIVA